jgi:hypothetical protein
VNLNNWRLNAQFLDQTPSIYTQNYGLIPEVREGKLKLQFKMSGRGKNVQKLSIFENG